MIFVIHNNAGRIKLADITSINLIMSSIDHTESIPYGIVMNQVSKNPFNKIRENKEEWIKKVNLNLNKYKILKIM